MHPVGEVFEKEWRFIDSDDAPGGSDDFGQVDGGVPGAAADIKDGHAGPDGAALPQGVGRGGPEAVLEAEAHRLLLAGAEDVFLVRLGGRAGWSRAGHGRKSRRRR
jgi:hypothetical protein